MKQFSQPKRILLSFLVNFLIFSFGASFFWTELISSVYAGVPKLLSFQGRLTDASGNLIGGNGANRYFKFDIYPSLTGGSSSWSSGGTAITIKVTQGVFNTLLGDTSAGYSALDLNFDLPAYYLEIQVSDTISSGFETLSPRQRIVASGFAINAETVHGGRFLNATGVGQFGGLATVAYSRFGTDTTSHAGTIDASNDLLVSGGLEVNGSASFDGTVFFGGTASHTAAGEWNFDSNTLVIDSGTDRVSVGTSAATRKFNVLAAVSVAQFRLGQSDSVYGEFYVDSAGDIRVSATGGNIRQNDENLWVCSGGGCGATAPVDRGNVIIETSVIFDNNFKFKQSIDGVTASKSVTMYDSGSNITLEFDEEQN
jgi:hypothetical protein